MTTSIHRRLLALERPQGHDCLSCELARLREASTMSATHPPPACTHWQHRTLAQELAELNNIESTTP